jgi:hypothetical protein
LSNVAVPTRNQRCSSPRTGSKTLIRLVCQGGCGGFAGRTSASSAPPGATRTIRKENFRLSDPNGSRRRPPTSTRRSHDLVYKASIALPWRPKSTLTAAPGSSEPTY